MAVIKWRNHHLEDIEIALLLEAMKARYGYDFSNYAHASLKRRLKQLRDYFDVPHLSHLIPSLLYDERVAQVIINNISVLASDFFRDPPVWRYLRDEIVPRLATFPRINIWQAGCGRGQETYSLLILLHECGLLDKTRLVATDINVGAMDEARAGRWSARDLDRWRTSYLAAGGQGHFDDYFQREGDTVMMVEHLRQKVEFNQHNLVTDEVFMEAQFIVCRNVLIYFDDTLQERVLELFGRSLQRGGYLLLGRAENVLQSSLAGRCFQKIDAGCNVLRRTAEVAHAGVAHVEVAHAGGLHVGGQHV